MIYTTIYWLVDMRPEVLETHPAGIPFYCGMTKRPLKTVLPAVLKRARSVLTETIKECGPHVEVRIMEVVDVFCGKREKLERWRHRMAAYQQPIIHDLQRVKRKPQSLTRQEAWVERQHNVAVRNRKLPPPPY